MYRKMLVLLDGSKLSEVVFGYAQQLAGRLKLDLDLLHVCGREEAEELPMRQAYMEHMADILRTQAEEVTSEAGVRTEGRWIHAQGSVVVGDPAEEIAKYVDQNRPDLVMMSTHGRSGCRACGIGDVADRVLHAAKIPVWLVPSELSRRVVMDTMPKRNLVIPLDGSRVAEAVLPHAITIATQRGAEAELVLVHVHDPSRVPVFLAEDEMLAGVKRYLDGVADEIHEAGFAARSEILRGDAATTLVRFLKDNPPQLLAMAMHTESGPSGTIFGSVTQYVLQTITETPMLLVSSSTS